jgi:hypothetical protein
MDILAVLAILVLLLAISFGSFVRSCFVRGRLHGMQESATEMMRGFGSHIEAEGELPASVARALEILKTRAKGVSHARQMERRRADLWVFGDAIGSSCWSKGYRAGKQTMAPREDRILVELPASELLQLAWLAHLGFQHMMPNYRGFETYRFSGEEDARGGAKAIERLEVCVPAAHRATVDPVASSNARLALIDSWWSNRKVACG